MLTVKVTHSFTGLPLERQLPTGNHVWENCRFLINTPERECDFWMVLQDLQGPETALCPPENVALFLFEYPEIQPVVNSKFLQQFPTVFSFGRDFKHRNRIDMVSCFPWMFGMEFHPGGKIGSCFSFEELERADYREKSQVISVISSNKCQTRGHRRRLTFVRALKEHFGSRMEVFGRGIRDCKDKLEAIAPYKYHIALENSVCVDGPSEKLYDAFLGNSYPLYYGCPNVFDYFPRGSLTPIDIERPREAMQIIERTIQQNTFEKEYSKLVQAKKDVLYTFNIFSKISSYCQSRWGSGKPREVVSLRSEKYFPWSFRAQLQSKLRAICHRGHGLLHALGY